MPITQQRRIELAQAAVAEFESGFRRSRKGNLWRHWEGMTISIFERSDGFQGWCIAGHDDEKQFSSAGYETEEGALVALARELDVL